jgi:hypothetical protein
MSINLQKIVLVVLVGLVSPVLPEATAQDTFSGTGTATMGSEMTPSATKKLAFEFARKAALEQFGTHVVARQSVSSAEAADEVRQMSETRISALATGEARLVPGSKKISRQVTEHAIVYTVRAKFEIDATKFRETLEAYASEQERSAQLRDAVEDVVDVQERLAEFEESNTGVREVESLLDRAKTAYTNMKGAIKGVDGQSVLSKISDQRQKRKSALLDYLTSVRDIGIPYDLVKVKSRDTDFVDKGEAVKIKHTVEYQKSEQARTLQSVCDQTRQTWAPRVEGTAARRHTGWMQSIFENRLREFELELPILLFLLDRDDKVLGVVTGTSSGMMAPPSVEFAYGRCSVVDLPAKGRFEEEAVQKWEATLPRSVLAKTSKIAVFLSVENYRTQLSALKRIGSNRFVRPGHTISRQSLQYSKDDFTRMVGSYIEKVKD